MATKHVLQGERINPSRQSLKRKLKTAEIIEGFTMKPGYLYTVVRAISARVNQNYDGWPSDELKKSAHTFIGKPVFVNHENYDPDKARGVVIAARYVAKGADKYVEVIQEIDAQRFPKLAAEIRTGGLDSVSMGAEAGFTICSFCGNKAYDVPDMCEHVLFHKGEKLSRFNKRTGKREEVLVYESCHKLSFFELSYVFDPADETAVASKVLVAAKHTAADCPPGADCTIHPKEEQISADSPNNPLNQQGGSSSGAATSSGTPSGGAAKAIGGGELGKTPAAGGTPVSTGGGGVPLVKNPDGSYTSSDPAWAHLIDRESGGQNIKQSPSTQDVNSGGNEAFGVFQITPGTWSSHGGQGSVYDSTPEQQADVAANILRSNPSGSDWGAGMSGREDAAALSSGLGQPKAASFEDRVLKVAGFKRADKCHYCAGDAEEGFSSCSGHRKMEENKFTKKVLEAAGMHRMPDHPGRHEQAPDADPRIPTEGYQVYDSADWLKLPHEFEASVLRAAGFSDWTHDPATDSYTHPNGHVIKPSDEADGYQLWAPTVVMRGDPGLAKDRQPHPDLQRHMDWAEHTGSFEDRVIDAFRKGAPFADYSDFNDCTSKNSDKGDADAYCGEIKHRTEDKTGASSPFTDSSGRYQGPMKSKTSYPSSPYGDGDNCPECGQHFTQGHAPGCSKASKWGSKMNNFEARVLRAWGETEAPASVDTLREEGSAPEDDNNDFYHYVEPPKELQTPDLSEATQIDREQDEMGMDTDGAPGPASMDAPAGPPQPQQQYMELKIPIPQPGQAGAGGAPAIPMQPYQDQPPQPPAGPPPGAPPGPPGPPPPEPPQQIAASTLAYFDRYFGHRVGRINLQTLENGRAGFTKSRNPMKGTANMARSTLAERGKVVTAGRRRHFADGPLVDTGDQSRNDQGEQEEVFITQTPPAEVVDAPTDDTPNISNTENNLVAKVRRGRDQLLRDAQALATYRRKTAGEQDEAGGPVATEVNPTVNTGPAGEELTGDDFESADPNADVVETQPKDASLHAFKSFDKWLASKTGKPCRAHTSATIRRAADDYSRAAGISVQAMFPALGIVLREARKNDKPNTKGANMRRRADEKLEVAAPDGRIDVEAPTEDTTDEEAQASQFDLNDFGNNAGDNLADPDLSTDQNWAPGEAKKSSKVKTAGGILAFRCAEAMIAAGLEPNTVERKYTLATDFENMNRGLVQDRTALCERFARILQAERQKVASGNTRGAALKPPVPTGLTQGMQRSAATQRVAANDPRNDSTMFV